MIVECRPGTPSHAIIELWCEGEKWREVHVSIFGRRPDFSRSFSGIEDFSEHFDEMEYKLSKLYGLKRLSQQALTSKVLANSLKRKCVSDKSIERVIQEFTVLGYLNDQEWAASFIRCQTNRHAGPRLIAAKLARKGIRLQADSEEMRAVSDQQKESIQHLLSSKYKSKDLSDFKTKQKVAASLIRKGFDPSSVFAVLND